MRRAAALVVAGFAALYAQEGRAEMLRHLIHNTAGEIGATPCRTYLEATPQGQVVVESWVGAFLSGFGTKSQYNILSGIDGPWLRARTQEVCRAAPAFSIADAAEVVSIDRVRDAWRTPGEVVMQPAGDKCSGPAYPPPNLRTWATGYISGFAAYVGSPLWGDLSGPAIERRVDQFCAENRDARLYEAARTIYDALAKRP